MLLANEPCICEDHKRVGNFSRICAVPEAGEKVVALATGNHTTVAWGIDRIFLLQRSGSIHVPVHVTPCSLTGNLT